MIFHLLLNSLIVFIILTLLIEFALSILNITNARFRYFLRLLPIFKFPLDLIVFLFVGENLFVNFNPFSCQVYMQDLISSIANFHIQNESVSSEHFIIPKYIASYIPSDLLNITITFMLAISCLIMIKKVYLFYLSRSSLQKIFSESSLCTRTIFNQILLNRLKRGNIVIRTSNTIHIPFAANLRDIYIPQELTLDLSQDEFESVIIHELAHLRWKDPIMKMSCELLCAIFWWLPSAWWLRRLELEQEDACDAEVYDCEIDVMALATAMIKIVKKAKYQRYQFAAISTFDSPKNNHVRRVENILHIKNMKGSVWHCLVAVSACLFAVFSFWMC